MHKSLIIILFGALVACNSQAPKSPNQDWLHTPWPAIEQAAKGSTVHLMMWQGDPLINQYISGWVAPELKKRYDIQLDVAPGQGTEIVKILLAEKDAGKQSSSIDLCWINGETFFQLRQIHALFGPYAPQLPNAQYIDFENPFIGIDFQQKVDGFECPWGNVQLAMIYDSIRTPVPPKTLDELEAYCKAHPGKFTLPYEFTGMTLLKSWMIALAGDKNALDGPFDEKKYTELSVKLWDYINRIKPNFWRKGATFPESIPSMHQMFANGELDFTMSNNDNEVDNKVLQKNFPGSSKSFVFTSGTIQNSHFMGIPSGATNQAGAMVVVNFLISPEAQFQKLQPDVWGDGTVLSLEKLPATWRDRFEHVPQRHNAALRSEIQPFALKEPAPEYMIRLYRDFRKNVLEK